MEKIERVRKSLAYFLRYLKIMTFLLILLYIEICYSFKLLQRRMEQTCEFNQDLDMQVMRRLEAELQRYNLTLPYVNFK
jgi:hypothetical protein